MTTSGYDLPITHPNYPLGQSELHDAFMDLFVELDTRIQFLRELQAQTDDPAEKNRLREKIQIYRHANDLAYEVMRNYA